VARIDALVRERLPALTTAMALQRAIDEILGQVKPGRAAPAES
jgi:hypothetical protein